MLPPFIAAAFRAAPGNVLTTAELGRIGVPRKWVLALIEEGLIERMIFGVHRDPSLAATPTQHLHVVRAYLEQRRPEGCRAEVFSGGEALAVRGLEGFTLGGVPLVLMDPRRHLRRRRDTFTVLRTDLARVEVEQVDRLRLAAPPRALADAAGVHCVTDAQIRNAVDDLRHRWMLDIVSAVEWWAAQGFPGARRLTRMAEAGVFEQESDGERDAFNRLFLGYPPQPDCQVQLAPSIRVDFVFLSAALVIEYYGGVHDGSADRDSTRVWALRRMGYEVIVVTKSMLRDPNTLAAEIHAIRMQREHLIRAGHLRRPHLPPQPPRLSALRTFHAA